jgi:hypothetical protein
MSKRSEREEERLAEWEAGLARLEGLTRQFQRELGRLHQVAQDVVGTWTDPADELAAPPEDEDGYGS